MSNKKLLEATIPGHQGPLFPSTIERLHQEAYSVSRYKRHPVTPAFLSYFAAELTLMFRKVKFRETFITADGTEWMAVSFMWVNDIRFRWLFPKKRDRHHADGTVSAQHMALYYADTDEEISDFLLEQMGKTLFHLFRMDQGYYVHEESTHTST